MKEKEADEKANKVSLKAKGSALAKKKVSSFVSCCTTAVCSLNTCECIHLTIIALLIAPNQQLTGT